MWRFAPVFLLAACTGAPGGPCRLQQVADLPVTLDHNRLLATGQVNGLDTPLLIDTGSTRTILTNTVVDAVHLPRSHLSTTRLAGVGGAVSNADVFADVDLGGVTVRRRLAVANVPGVGGIIGGDVLSDYDLDLDLPHRRVRLWRAGGCSLAELPLHGANAVAVQVSDGRVHLPVAVDGKLVETMLDSGAATSLLSAEAARRLRVTQAVLAGDPAFTATGVDGGAIGVHRHGFGALTLGADHLAGARIGVADTELGGTEMLLGVDYLRTRRVWVAYRTGQVYLP